MITRLRNSWGLRFSAGLVAGAMASMFVSTTLPARADDTTTPAATTPAADTTATPAATAEVAATPVATPAIAVPLSSIKTILLFPVVNKAGDAYNTGAAELGTATKLKLNSAGLGRFVVTSYEPYMPAVQRALNVEDTLSQTELTPPFNDPDRARKVAQVVGSDGFAIVSLDSETIDEAAGTVKLAATMSLYATAYGDPIRTYPVTGASAKTMNTEDMVAVERRAVELTASNLVRSLTKDAGPPSSTTPPAVIKTAGGGNKGGAGQILLVLLAGLMVGVLANAGHSGHGSSGGGTVSTGEPGGDQLGTGGSSGGSGGTTPPSPPGVP